MEHNWKKFEEMFPVIRDMEKEKEVCWVNPRKVSFAVAQQMVDLTMADVEDAQKRLERFAPMIERCFPETKETHGIIESPLCRIPAMQQRLNEKYHSNLTGTLLLKKDSHLAIGGSIKARGGIYEVLKHTEEIALEKNLLTEEDLKGGTEASKQAYYHLADESARKVFGQYELHAASTGNLGLSIGIMSAAIGYDVTVHMSVDAKEWKKERLRQHGVRVIEYATDYNAAVEKGRKKAAQKPNSYFVDDENSVNLFLGYAVAAKRLIGQLKDLSIPVDEAHPLFVYIPCGVGGAPGGVSFGLKQVFGDLVHCFFVEPVKAPCMLLGMATGLHDEVSIREIGLDAKTHADGLAVARPSKFIGKVMEPFMSGEFTLKDSKLYQYMHDLLETEDVFLEPSACAAFQGPAMISSSAEMHTYLEEHGLLSKMSQATHIAWATGGGLVPAQVIAAYKKEVIED